MPMSFYVGRCQGCGSITAGCVIAAGDVMRDVLRMLDDGLAVERVIANSVTIERCKCKKCVPDIPTPPPVPEKPGSRHTAAVVFCEGGKWRTAVHDMAINQKTAMGSQCVFSMLDLEMIGAAAVAADRNERKTEP